MQLHLPMQVPPIKAEREKNIRCCCLFQFSFLPRLQLVFLLAMLPPPCMSLLTKSTVTEEHIRSLTYNTKHDQKVNLMENHKWQYTSIFYQQLTGTKKVEDHWTPQSTINHMVKGEASNVSIQVVLKSVPILLMFLVSVLKYLHCCQISFLSSLTNKNIWLQWTMLGGCEQWGEWTMGTMGSEQRGEGGQGPGRGIWSMVGPQSHPSFLHLYIYLVHGTRKVEAYWLRKHFSGMIR